MDITRKNKIKLNFLWEKSASHFLHDYKFEIAITIIHFAIYEMRSDNSNPVNILIEKSLIREIDIFHSSLIIKTLLQGISLVCKNNIIKH